MNPPDTRSKNPSMSEPETQVPTALSTERLVLRPFAESDADAVEKLLNDKEIASNTRSIQYPYPPGDALKWIARHRIMWENGDAYNFAIRLHASDELVGAIGLEANKIDHNAELGYWLGREFWNQGFATEAARRAIEFGFETIGFYRITAHHLTRNPASGCVLEKIGMTKEGFLRSHVRKWGVFEDVVLYGILANDPRP
jgi:ribosomal-protein-alanine N-acetyltransferase